MCLHDFIIIDTTQINHITNQIWKKNPKHFFNYKYLRAHITWIKLILICHSTVLSPNIMFRLISRYSFKTTLAKKKADAENEPKTMKG